MDELQLVGVLQDHRQQPAVADGPHHLDGGNFIGRIHDQEVARLGAELGDSNGRAVNGMHR